MADGNIFISYRRGADSNAAGRLYDRLERHFDRTRLFFDVDSIPLGVDFAEHIDGEVAKCDVQLVVIGPGWLEEIERLADPDDFVRIEIEAALKRPDIPVVPILLEGAEMPVADHLPESLRPLVRRNAIVLGHAHFAQVVDGRLTDALRAILDATPPEPTTLEGTPPDDYGPKPGTRNGRKLLLISAGTLWLVAAVGAWLYLGEPPSFLTRASDPDQQQMDPPASSQQEKATVSVTGNTDRDTETETKTAGSCAGQLQRDSDLAKLHPALREKVRLVQADLAAENIPFEVFETYTSPARQEALYAQGRTKPGAKVTWVPPWRSLHQFGLAVNFVLRINGQWSWDNQGEKAAYWVKLNELAQKHGLTPIYNSSGLLIESGHLQLPGVSVSDVYNEGFPAQGDESWSSNLHEILTAETACLDTVEKLKLGQHLLASLTGIADPQFQKLHAFVRKWEGGFVNDPQGGASNMGISQATLAAWRGEDVTVEDVRDLTRTDADVIMKITYFDECRCGEMPARTAMVVYDAAIMSGLRRAIMFLQTGLADLGVTVNGKSIHVDGVLGAYTLAAAKKADPSALADAIMDAREEYIRGHSEFPTFGRAWLSRLSALREFVDTLPENGGFWTTDIRLDDDSSQESGTKN